MTLLGVDCDVCGEPLMAPRDLMQLLTGCTCKSCTDLEIESIAYSPMRPCRMHGGMHARMAGNPGCGRCGVEILSAANADADGLRCITAGGVDLPR